MTDRDKPYIGEVVSGREIGSRNPRNKFIWSACEKCGKERWVRLTHGKPRNLLCLSCSLLARPGSNAGRYRENSFNWKGGQYIKHGYMYIRQPNHCLANDGYVKRAILVLEEKLGRSLQPGMDSHHINGIRLDDRPENLEEIHHNKHMTLHNRERRRQKNNNSVTFLSPES